MEGVRKESRRGIIREEDHLIGKRMEEGRRGEGENGAAVPVREYDMTKPTTLYTFQYKNLY